MTDKQDTRYRVTLINGWLVDSDGRYLRDCITDDCGHNHRSGETARKCQHRLMNWSKDGKSCSAYWYNSTVRTVDKYGRHEPKRQGQGD